MDASRTPTRVFGTFATLGGESHCARAQRNTPFALSHAPRSSSRCLASLRLNIRNGAYANGTPSSNRPSASAARGGEKSTPSAASAPNARVSSRNRPHARANSACAPSTVSVNHFDRGTRARRRSASRGDARVIIIDSVIIDIIVVDRSRARDEHVRDGREPADERLRRFRSPRRGSGVVLERRRGRFVDDDMMMASDDDARARSIDDSVRARRRRAREKAHRSIARASVARTLEDDGADDARDEEEVEENGRSNARCADGPGTSPSRARARRDRRARCARNTRARSTATDAGRKEFASTSSSKHHGSTRGAARAGVERRKRRTRRGVDVARAYAVIDRGGLVDDLTAPGAVKKIPRDGSNGIDVARASFLTYPEENDDGRTPPCRTRTSRRPWDERRSRCVAPQRDRWSRRRSREGCAGRPARRVEHERQRRAEPQLRRRRRRSPKTR